MKIAITGHRGHVGQELLQYPDVVPLDVDVREPKQVEMAIRSELPDVVIHLACISDVSKCEDPTNRNLVRDTNLRGTYHVADACEKVGSGMVFLSTDHVFDGIWGNYKESSKPHPKNHYGMSKLTAEVLKESFPRMKVVRTSKLFSNTTLGSGIGKLVAGEIQECPTFIYRSFMWLPHFVSSLVQFANRFEEMPKLLHISGSQTVSYYKFMQDVAKAFGIESDRIIARTKELPGLAPRPYRAGLNTSLSKKLGFSQFDYLDGLQWMKLG